jgi:hypothetical protein
MAIGPKEPTKGRNFVDELFSKIESAQGRAYISDGLFGSDERIFEVARYSREQHRKCVAIINRFLKKHGQLL